MINRDITDKVNWIDVDGEILLLKICPSGVID